MRSRSTACSWPTLPTTTRRTDRSPRACGSAPTWPSWRPTRPPDDCRSRQCRPTASATSGEPPLVIDLDGTLIRTDLLHESALSWSAASPVWRRGCRSGSSRQGPPEAPDREPRRASTSPRCRTTPSRWSTGSAASTRAAGASCCARRRTSYAQRVADHLGLFDEVIASDGVTNLSAQRKADDPGARASAQRGFDYAGNSRADLPVWRSARRAVRGQRRRGGAARGGPQLDASIASSRARPPALSRLVACDAAAPVDEEPAGLPAAGRRAPLRRVAAAAPGGRRILRLRPLRVVRLRPQRPDRPRERPRPSAQAAAGRSPPGRLSPLPAWPSRPAAARGWRPRSRSAAGAAFEAWLAVYFALTLAYTFRSSARSWSTA